MTTPDEVTLTEHEANLLKQVFITLGCTAQYMPFENGNTVLFTDGCRLRIDSFEQGLKAAAHVAERLRGRS